MDDGSTRAHADHDGFGQSGQPNAASAYAGEFGHLLYGDVINGCVHEGGANARDHDPLDIRESQIVFGGELAQRTVNRGDLIGGANENGVDQMAVFVKSNDLRGASAHVDSNDCFHSKSFRMYIASKSRENCLMMCILYHKTFSKAILFGQSVKSLANLSEDLHILR